MRCAPVSCTDGWAEVTGLNISDAQRWFRERLQYETLGWQDWASSGNQLMYMLNRNSNAHHHEMPLGSSRSRDTV